MKEVDVAVVGAGPVGLATALACQERGLSTVVLDRGGLCQSLQDYPRHMTFFSTAANLEIGGHSFPCVAPKPTRDEALEYYRGVAHDSELDFMLYHDVEEIEGEKGAFELITDRTSILAKRIVLATGFFTHPVKLGIPGESLPNVSHHFHDGHRYFQQDLVIVGGANSAVIAALESWRRGARVTLVHRKENLSSGVKYWLGPDFENRVAEGSIATRFESAMESIEPGLVRLVTPEGKEELPADFVLLLTGYRADHAWVEGLGLELNEVDAPKVNDHHESLSREGFYIVGCALCGEHTGDIFIENGREHAIRVARSIANNIK